jgi:hypothetical protein
MNTNKIKEFVERFLTYRKTDDYAERLAQSAITVVYRDIIQETLKNKQLTNENMTGLIQMFKYGCKDKTFDKYLAINITDTGRRNEISDKYYEVDQWGYTGAGLNAVTKLKPEQLKMIKKFLQNAFNINTIEEAIDLCGNFDNEDIPFVKSGVYSPWLHYINPQLFPIINNSHYGFREWMDIPADYPSCIKSFNELRLQVNETTLGMLDKFAYSFNSEEESWDLGSFLDDLHKNFPTIWRCATSSHWHDFRDNRVLSINWLESNKNYSGTKISGAGSTVIDRWVNRLKSGDLIVVLDKYKYYGIAIAKSTYVFGEKDVEFGGKLWPSIEVEFVHKLKEPVDHEMNITHTNPATFFELNGLSFSEEETFNFLKKSYPEAIERLIDWMGIGKSELSQQADQFKIRPLNSILYGPPGTGKTFNSINYAIAIIENKAFKDIETESDINRKGVKNRFDQYLADGQIVFTTFHQSLSYEDFIEGIKPVEPASEGDELTYAVEDGIFKRLCTEAAFSFIQKGATAETEKILDFSAEYDRFVDMVNEHLSQGIKTELKTRSGGRVYIENVSEKNNIWIWHVDGKKRHTVSKKRLSRIAQAFPDLTEVTNINDQFRAEIGGSNSSAYWAVLNAIRKQPPAAKLKDTKSISEKEYSYDDKKEIIESLKDDDYKIKNPKRYVIIIDEINRGNVSQIFGELITLIEDDKRLGKDEALRAKLPYSKNGFGVPCNIYLIGTMNTADRSVEALDSALRRRFSFIQMLPKPDRLKTTTDNINLSEVLQVLNNRLAVLKDNDHTIGHAWLWNVNNLDALKNAFKDKILPLLQEYFYNDYEKLGLVLGDAFFQTQTQIKSDIFASFTGGNGLSGQYDQSWQYQLKSADDLTFEDFKSLEQSSNNVLTDEE